MVELLLINRFTDFSVRLAIPSKSLQPQLYRPQYLCAGTLAW